MGRWKISGAVDRHGIRAEDRHHIQISGVLDHGRPVSDVVRQHSAHEQAPRGGAVHQWRGSDGPDQGPRHQMQAELLEEDGAFEQARAAVVSEELEQAQIRHFRPDDPVHRCPLAAGDGVEREAVGAETGSCLLQLELALVQAELHGSSPLVELEISTY
jgi:hypothetical protein